MEKAVNQVETKDQRETVAAPEKLSVAAGGSCPTCRSGLDPTIITGDFQESLRDGL